MASDSSDTHPDFPDPRLSRIGRLVLSELNNDARSLRGVEFNIIRLKHMVGADKAVDLDMLHRVVDGALSDALKTRPTPPGFVAQSLAQYEAAGLRMPLVAKIAALELTEMSDR